ncbi:MAG: GIY-YIG nuclease family protein [Bacteroidota bacterium]|nr:GIY-YIG nuclease family protein [Bacteroidota bacterium]
MEHFIYILYSETRDRNYIGSCADVNERLIRHNAGAVLSTKSGRPWKVVYSETFSSKIEALKRELYLKRMKSSVYLEDLIRKYLQGNFPIYRD